MAKSKLFRKAASGPKVKWNIKVPADLAAIIENHFWSVTYGKPIYGKRNDLIVSKLWEYVNENNLMSEAPISVDIEPNPQTST